MRGGGEGEGKEKERDIVRGSLPTIRITKDGHDERQRRAEEGGRKGKKFNYKHRGGTRE